MVIGLLVLNGLLAAAAAEVQMVSLDDAHEMWQQQLFDVVIDVRTVENATFANGWGWNHGHIPGSFPLRGLVESPIDPLTVGEYNTSACKSSKVLVHCWVGVAGLQGAQALVAMGFTDVYAIQEAGIWEWETRGYEMVYGDTFIPGTTPPCANEDGITLLPISEAHELWSHGVFNFVVDVRTVENATFANGWGWNHGHIPGSFSLRGLVESPIDLLTVGEYNTSACKSKRVLVHCWVGVAGLQGAQALVAMGFTNVYAIKDAGIWEWEDRGYEMVYGDTYIPGASPHCADEDGITFLPISEAHELWSHGVFDFVVDVRTVENATFANGWGWNHGHIPGSFSLRGLVEEPMDMMALLPYNTSGCKSSRVLVHCWVGVAGAQGAEALVAMGFTNVYAIQDAGIWEWEAQGYEMVYGDTYDPSTRPQCTSVTCADTKREYKAMSCCGVRTGRCAELKHAYKHSGCCQKHSRL